MEYLYFYGEKKKNDHKMKKPVIKPGWWQTKEPLDFKLVKEQE